MEDHRFVDRTLELLPGCARDGAPATSTVLQAYLHRTPADLEALLAEHPRGPRGAHRQGRVPRAPEVALQDMPAIRRAFLAACERAWRARRQGQRRDPRRGA
jgi:hypothetical protein